MPAQVAGFFMRGRIWGMAEYPNDADGDALRRVASHGSDMDKPMLVEFQVAASSEESAKQIATAAYNLGYRVKLYGKGHDWTCECSTRMLATYDGISAIQEELTMLSAAHGGRPDGWGTFGNSESNSPSAH
jgi:regulator of RNase E activity RraB